MFHACWRNNADLSTCVHEETHVANTILYVKKATRNGPATLVAASDRPARLTMRNMVNDSSVSCHHTYDGTSRGRTSQMWREKLE